MSFLKKTKILKVDPRNPDSNLIRYAAAVIKLGGLVAFPTETVYGVAANLLDKKAVERLYRVKRRPRSKPFTVHISDLNSIKDMECRITKSARPLIDKFWPGPLTIILRAKNGAKIGFRMPANRIALDLIRAAGVPVIAPSANVSGSGAPSTAKAVLKELDGKIDALLDAGRAEFGVESTVVDLTARPARILREGAIGRVELEKTIRTNRSKKAKPKAKSKKF